VARQQFKGNKRFLKAVVEDERTLNVYTSRGLFTIEAKDDRGNTYVIVPAGFALVRDGATTLYKLVKE
jgi:hypothetical protein